MQAIYLHPETHKVLRFRIFYSFGYDDTENVTVVDAENADDAARVFRNGLTDDELQNLTVNKIERL